MYARMRARSANRAQRTQHVLVAGAGMTIEVCRSSAIDGALRLRKNGEVTLMRPIHGNL